jgi:hypothetical protein
MFAGCFSQSSRSTLLLRGRVRRRLTSVIALKVGIAQLRLNRCSIPLTLFIEDILSAALLKSDARATCSAEASREIYGTYHRCRCFLLWYLRMRKEKVELVETCTLGELEKRILYSMSTILMATKAAHGCRHSFGEMCTRNFQSRVQKSSETGEKEALRRCCYTRPATQNISSRTTLYGWLFSYERFSVLEPHSTEILCKRISWMVAHTIVRQLVSVVKTSI